jgi:glycerate 2-kinase
MRVLIAPDKFAGTLTAVEAADAIADGWRRSAPDDAVTTAPLSDGGPGFVDVVHAALGGTLLSVTATGPHGEQVPTTLLLVEGTAYVEAAQACGLHLVPPEERDPTTATSYGVGQLIGSAVDEGAARVVVGLGGSATNDGGAGMLAALGAAPVADLRQGGAALAELEMVDLEPARERVAGIELIAATDVDNSLLGLRGASNVFGAQKGASSDDIQRLDAALTTFAERTDRRLADSKGAGAAGGLGFGLALLGASRVPGIATVLDLVSFDALVSEADVVVTGEGSFDYQSLRGKVVNGVAEAATRQARPTVVLAGRIEVGRREMAAVGVESAYSVVDLAGSVDAALDRPAERLAELAARVARTWSRR